MPFLGDMLVPRRVLVGGWTNPSEKYARQIGSSPQVSSKVLWIAKLLILPLLASFDKVFKPKCTWSLHSNDNGHPSLLQIHDEGFAGKAGICDNLCQCVTSLFLLNSLSWQFCFLHSFVTSPITSVDPQWHRFHACTSDIESFGPDCMAKSAQKNFPAAKHACLTFAPGCPKKRVTSSTFCTEVSASFCPWSSITLSFS